MPDHKKAALVAQEAKHGKRMIEVSLRFWTNGIAKSKGKIMPKHAWSAGVVRIQGNESHGIVSGNPKPFHSLLDVGSVVEGVLIKHGITLHCSRRMKKYMAED
jgi:hypothetical protein